MECESKEVDDRTAEDAEAVVRFEGPESQDDHHHHHHHIRRAVIGNIGSVFEWMEFASFGFMAEFISDTFFPDSSKSAGLLETFAVFAGAFFMRPIGGVLLGYVGDKRGRKAALVTSIILMTVATVTTEATVRRRTMSGWIA